MEMNSATKRILKITAQIIVTLPLLSALAGLVLGPTVLHPFRRRLTVWQMAQADQILAGVTREDFVVRADDGIILGGRHMMPDQSNGYWVRLLHVRSHNRF